MDKPSDSTSSTGLRRAVVALVAVVAISLTGCGVSSTAVKATETTAEVTTTVDEATTTVEETTTTVEEEPTTTVEETTTTSGGGSDGGEWPKEAKDSFMNSCTAGGDTATMTPICECVLRAVQGEISVADLMDVGKAGTLPADLQELITDKATKCAVDPNSY